MLAWGLEARRSYGHSVSLEEGQVEGLGIANGEIDLVGPVHVEDDDPHTRVNEVVGEVLVDVPMVVPPKGSAGAVCARGRGGS